MYKTLPDTLRSEHLGGTIRVIGLYLLGQVAYLCSTQDKPSCASSRISLPLDGLLLHPPLYLLRFLCRARPPCVTINSNCTNLIKHKKTTDTLERNLHGKQMETITFTVQEWPQLQFP